MPSATPGGMRTPTVRRERTRPSPPHCRHGSGITSPKPRQLGHGREVTTWPRNERCTLCTSPRPLQMSHIVGTLPGAQPDPVHSPQSTAVSTVRSRVTPVLQSSRVSRIRIRASAPGCTRLRGPRPRPPAWPPKNASMMSPKPNALNGSAAAAPASAVAQRVAAEVDDAALLRVGQHLVGRAHLAEAFLRPRVGVHVGVQLTRQPAVGPLDLVGAGVWRDAQCPVVIPYHVRVPHGPSRSVLLRMRLSPRVSVQPGSHPRTGPRRAPPRSSPGSPSSWAREPPCHRARCPARSRWTPRRCRASPRPRSPHRCAP